MLLVFACLALIVWFIIYLNRRATLYYAFEDLAKRYLGRAANRFSGLPQATFQYRDLTARITTHFRLPRHGGRHTRLLIDWPDRRFQLVVRPNSVGARGIPGGGLQRFEIDPEVLAGKFEVWSNDLEMCGQILSPASLWQLGQLAEMSRKGFVYWRIRRGKFLLSVGGHFRKKQQLNELVAKMLDLYSQAQLSQAQGLDFVDDQMPSVIDKMICPICSGPIGGDLVICVRCRAPHCKECWTYNGKCATFACGGEKYLNPHATQSSQRRPSR